MRTIFTIAMLLLFQFSFAQTVCHATKAFQTGSSMVSEVELRFDWVKNEGEIELKNIVGHVFVKSPFEDGLPNFSTEDSYMGFFKIDSLKADKNYHPNKYKGYQRFLKFNAAETAGLESGMWGDLLLDFSTQGKGMRGAYIFQAGDHMGGTILLDCVE